MRRMQARVRIRIGRRRRLLEVEGGSGESAVSWRRYQSGQLSLVRREDGWKIPYGSLKSVSLIALLRMGLGRVHKARLYKLFAGMPLYEDMAPWNIVAQGSTLQYIDQDTKDKTFDAEVARAYQTMSALMNYIRTVKDFGKCEGKARGGNQYGIPFVSDCVRSKFEGPCTSSAKPIPW